LANPVSCKNHFVLSATLIPKPKYLNNIFFDDNLLKIYFIFGREAMPNKKACLFGRQAGC
jgi:hypothetical protein